MPRFDFGIERIRAATSSTSMHISGWRFCGFLPVFTVALRQAHWGDGVLWIISNATQRLFSCMPILVRTFRNCVTSIYFMTWIIIQLGFFSLFVLVCNYDFMFINLLMLVYNSINLHVIWFICNWSLNDLFRIAE